jgi:hypothetical protein
MERVESLTYPCGHVYLPLYGDGTVAEAIPLSCQRCSQHTIFYSNMAAAKALISGITCADNVITVDLLCQPIEPLEHIDIQFTVNGGGIVWQDDH